MPRRSSPKGSRVQRHADSGWRMTILSVGRRRARRTDAYTPGFEPRGRQESYIASLSLSRR
jgi:hypothetical protein